MSTTIGLPPLAQLLRQGQLCVLSTVDQAGRPYSTIVNWVVAVDDATLAVVLGAESTAVRNLGQTPWVAVEVLASEHVMGLRGHTCISPRTIAACPFAHVVVDIAVVEARNHTGTGIVWQGPTYRYIPGKEHRDAVERHVLAELRAGPRAEPRSA